MKQAATISLLLMLIFNSIGYRLLSHYAEKRQDLHLEARINNKHFNEADLFEITVPLDLPYQADWQDYERFDGEIEVDGIHYKYVKRRVYQGNLVLLCIPNEGKMQIQTARDQFFRLMNDLQHSSDKSPGSSHSTIKAPFQDYFASDSFWKLIAPPIQSILYNTEQVSFYNFSYQFISIQPPDLNSCFI